MSTGKNLVKKSVIRSVVAAAAMFLHATSVSNEAVSLTVKTIDGYVNQKAEGTWINDIHACFKRKAHGVQFRTKEGEPDVVRTVVNLVCPPVVS